MVNSTFFENEKLNETILKHRKMLNEIETFINNLEVSIDNNTEFDKK